MAAARNRLGAALFHSKPTHRTAPAAEKFWIHPSTLFEPDDPFRALLRRGK
jgi:hypothetical protein